MTTMETSDGLCGDSTVLIQLCPICLQPVGNDHPEAQVYHMTCLMKVIPTLEKRKQDLKTWNFQPAATM